VCVCVCVCVGRKCQRMGGCWWVVQRRCVPTVRAISNLVLNDDVRVHCARGRLRVGLCLWLRVLVVLVRAGVCACMCRYLHMCICIQPCMCMCMRMCMCLQLCMCMCMCMCMCTQLCMCMCMNMQLCLCMSMCLCACACACACAVRLRVCVLPYQRGLKSSLLRVHLFRLVPSVASVKIMCGFKKVCACQRVRAHQCIKARYMKLAHCCIDPVKIVVCFALVSITALYMQLSLSTVDLTLTDRPTWPRTEHNKRISPNPRESTQFKAADHTTAASSCCLENLIVPEIKTNKQSCRQGTHTHKHTTTGHNHESRRANCQLLLTHSCQKN